ncbi:MAG: restriction endonuclease subunit S [Candidatus Delongbacteria bacterium]|nr:restriction endonuclease subunit S [Candidatus Delongbacteria bacterium]
MKQETFFKKFDQFADAPDAVAKMRELVLELAIQGKLVAQDGTDEPARKQLERIAAKKLKTGRVARVKARAGASSATEDIETYVPDGWENTSLAALVTVLNGRAYSKDELLEAGTPVLRVGNLFTSKHWYYSDLELELDKYCDTGDLIFAWSASFGPFIWPGPKVIYHYHIWKLELHSEADLHKGYLYWFLQNKTQEIRRAGHGVSMLHMTKEKMEKLEVVLPPLAEQKRIVAKVDELMALCDRLEAQQQERETRHAALARASLARFADAPTPANLNFLFHPSYDISPADLRKSILTLAVQGKLVPQDPNDEDARAMIDRAMAERQQTIKTKSLRRKELDDSVDLFVHADLPSSWCVERIANLVDPENTISYGVLVPGIDVPDGIPFVRAQDLRLANHPLRPNKTIAPEIEKPYARTRLTGGEILLCVVGSIGKLGVVPDSWAGANIARAVARIKPIPDVLRDYLLLVLQEQSVQNYFTSTTRTLAQPTLNVGMIEQTPIPIPPLAEQRRIVAKVEQLMALVDELESQLADSRAIAKDLLSALIAELTS